MFGAGRPFDFLEVSVLWHADYPRLRTQAYSQDIGNHAPAVWIDFGLAGLQPNVVGHRKPNLAAALVEEVPVKRSGVSFVLFALEHKSSS